MKRSHLPSREKQEELEGSWAQKIGAAAAAAARESHAYKMKAYWKLHASLFEYYRAPKIIYILLFALRL